MANFNTNLKIIGAVVLVLVILILFNTLSPVPVANRQATGPNVLGILGIGLLIGALIMFLVWRLTKASNKKIIKEDSHTVIESVRRVFKVVCAEGHFNELYNFEETKKLFGLIPSTKRALVIIQARVLLGFDFEKCVWEADEANRKIKLHSFPSPEILSIETDYKYYNFDENIFNLLGREDLTRIQTNGKKQVEAAALKSQLPGIAADQMRILLSEVVQSKNWQLENPNKISESRVMSDEL